MKDPAFRKLFPDIIEKWKSGQQQLGASASPNKDSATGEKEKGAVSGEGGKAAGEEEKPKAGGATYSDIFVLFVVVLIIAFVGGRIFDMI